MNSSPADNRPAYHGVKMLAIIFSSMCLLTVAMTLGLGHLYMMAVAIAAVPLLSYLVGKQMLQGIEVKRLLPQVAWDHQPAKIQLEIRNRHKMPKYFVQARDMLPEGAQFYDGDGSIPIAVSSHATQQASYSVLFSRRGRYKLGPLTLHATDPLGLFFFSHRLPGENEIVILPTPLPLPPLREAGGAHYAAAGAQSVATKGDSVEFLGIREYVAGDPLRRVDWKHSARYGHLFVRDFERYTQTEAVVLLDCDGVSKKEANLFEIMVKAASGALHLAYQSGLPFRLVTGYSGTDSLPSAWGMESLYRLLYLLAEISPLGDGSWRQAVSRAISEAPPGSLFVFIPARVEEHLLQWISTTLRHQGRVVVLLPNSAASEPHNSYSGTAGALQETRLLHQLYSMPISVIPISSEVRDE